MYAAGIAWLQAGAIAARVPRGRINARNVLSLVVLKIISTPGPWTCFGLAYLIEFLMPTFDFFPLSCGRLASPLLWMGIVWDLSARPPAPSDLFLPANRALDLSPAAGPQGAPASPAQP